MNLINMFMKLLIVIISLSMVTYVAGRSDKCRKITETNPCESVVDYIKKGLTAKEIKQALLSLFQTQKTCYTYYKPSGSKPTGSYSNSDSYAAKYPQNTAHYETSDSHSSKNPYNNGYHQNGDDFTKQDYPSKPKGKPKGNCRPGKPSKQKVGKGKKPRKPDHKSADSQVDQDLKRMVDDLVDIIVTESKSQPNSDLIIRNCGTLKLYSVGEVLDKLKKFISNLVTFLDK